MGESFQRAGVVERRHVRDRAGNIHDDDLVRGPDGGREDAQGGRHDDGPHEAFYPRAKFFRDVARPHSFFSSLLAGDHPLVPLTLGGIEGLVFHDGSLLVVRNCDEVLVTFLLGVVLDTFEALHGSPRFASFGEREVQRSEGHADTPRQKGAEHRRSFTLVAKSANEETEVAGEKSRHDRGDNPPPALRNDGAQRGGHARAPEGDDDGRGDANADAEFLILIGADGLADNRGEQDSIRKHHDPRDQRCNDCPRDTGCFLEGPLIGRPLLLEFVVAPFALGDGVLDVERPDIPLGACAFDFDVMEWPAAGSLNWRRAREKTKRKYRS